MERGYAGFSLWDWHKLPDYLDPRYTDYARANASIGINGTVLTNVNANANGADARVPREGRGPGRRLPALGNPRLPDRALQRPHRDRRPGDRRSPRSRGGASGGRRRRPRSTGTIPDFGGFLVKANSEGQPGPQDYGRSHAEGANMLADAVAPHGGVVMWRAFVYSSEEPEDRAKQAYNEFVPLDGSFRPNVLIQVKNGPIDFQPREPFHPLFGAMPKTPLMMEFQITQEYLGFATHLAFLAPLYEEVLRSDTHAKGEGSLVADVIDGSLHGYERTGIAGVANTGTDRNWCGSVMACANWYAFGRLAWDPGLDVGGDRRRVDPDDLHQRPGLRRPREGDDAGLARGGGRLHDPAGAAPPDGRAATTTAPAPGSAAARGPTGPPSTTTAPTTSGIGFDRTKTGSDAVSQYFPPVRDAVREPRDRARGRSCSGSTTCPGTTRWRRGGRFGRSCCTATSAASTGCARCRRPGASLEGRIDAERYEQVRAFLAIQEKEARWWRDACVLYFQTFSGRPIPEGYERPERTLEEYEAITHPYAPGI